MNWVSDVKSEIGKGKISKALKIFAEHNKDEDTEIQLLNIVSRWNTLAEESLLGILARDRVTLERQQITYALLNLLKSVPAEKATSMPGDGTNTIITNGNGNIIIQGVSNSKIEIKQ